MITAWFVARTSAWFNIVLREGLNITDFWGRYEYARSRGAIHYHALVYAAGMSATLHSLLNAAASALTPDALKGELSVAALKVDRFAAQLSMSSLHPSGISRSVDSVAHTRWSKYIQYKTGVIPAGNIDEWPAPEGFKPRPATNPLTQPLFGIAANQLRGYLVDLVNRLQLHKCSSYCLKVTGCASTERD